jgi:hypothetical protein
MDSRRNQYRAEILRTRLRHSMHMHQVAVDGAMRDAQARSMVNDDAVSRAMLEAISGANIAGRSSTDFVHEYIYHSLTGDRQD